MEAQPSGSGQEPRTPVPPTCCPDHTGRLASASALRPPGSPHLSDGLASLPAPHSPSPEPRARPATAARPAGPPPPQASVGRRS